MIARWLYTFRSHVSVVLSGLALSFPPVPINKGLGLTFTSAHILVRALVDGRGSQPTDTKDHIKCVVRALVAIVAVSLPHVCHCRETGLPP